MSSTLCVPSGTGRTAGKCSAGREPFAFDVTNPEVVAWAQQNAAELVTAITEAARATIQMIIVRGFEEGLAVPDIARLLRNTIGLTERDAMAVMTRQLKLLAAGTETRMASAAAERYAEQLRNRRALTIARTETMKAANQGQLQLWRQAQAKGHLPLTVRKVWIIADACPLCAPLSGEEVLLDQDFTVGQDPPLHPRCRCTVGLSV